VREILIKAGFLVPVDVVAARPARAVALGAPMLRLLGSEDWRPRENEPWRGPGGRP
jgi:hypothetical protein